VGSRSRDSGFRSGAIDELRVWRRALTSMQARMVALADGVTPASTQAADDLAVHYADAIDGEVAAARAAWRDAQRQLAAHFDAMPSIVCMHDSPFADPTFVLRRGAYDQPDLAQRCEPSAPSIGLPFDASFERDRRGLAAWMCHPQNPLTARVAINRLWTQMFGRGLVETAENFGLQGAHPANAALLDRLARDFADGDGTNGSKWSIRRMLFRIARSATFTQSSALPTQADDAQARYEPSRLSAEALRDQALFASGLLAPRFLGPSVKPAQPDGLWADAGQGGGYAPSTGDDAYRRSLSTFRKRTVPPPSLATFDAPSRESCAPRRLLTNTPLQALALLNDPTFVECARSLALRVHGERTSMRDRVERAFRLVCTRMPTAGELDALHTLLEASELRYRESPADAALVCGAEDAQLAALTLACQTILCSDAAVVMR
jgi:hypothetical protein